MPRHAGGDSPPTSRRRPARRRGGGLLRSRDGLAALEFAIIAPFMIVVFTGLYDVVTGFLAWQRVNQAAQSIIQIATAQAATNSNTNIVTLANAQTAATAIYAYLPDTMTASTATFGVVMTSVVITGAPSGCTTACTSYTANVAWSGRFQGAAGVGTVRSCGTLSWTAADSTAPSATTLPPDLEQLQPVLVVDVYYTFVPLFLNFFIGNVTMMQSAYFAPRTGMPTDWVQYYKGASDSYTPTVCAGYALSAVP